MRTRRPPRRPNTTARAYSGMIRAVIVLALMGVVLFFAAGMLPGCAPAPHYTQADVRPVYASPSGEARSLVADSPAMVEYGGDRPDAWYRDRNDRRPAVIAGYREPVFRAAHTYTSDRLHSTSSGRVYDHFSQTTYRTRSTVGYE